MKNSISIIAIILFAFHTNFSQAQDKAWEKSSKVLALGIGFAQFYHLDDYYYYDNNKNIKNNNNRSYRVITEQLNFQGEFGIHPYVGLGFIIGVGGRGPHSNHYNGELNIPVGMISNFHFYQLIADNNKKNMHANKMDIYAGISVGSGVAFTYYDNSNRVVPLAFGGVHAGIRYYLSPKFGLNAEVGLGKSVVNAGFVFKL